MKLGKGIELKDSHLSTARNRIALVGIELEGGWEKLPKGAEVTRDSSVRFPIPIAHVGEIVSRPLELTEYAKWMKTFYPHHVNETCGMHVHMSFKTALTYSRLMNAKYPATVVRYVRKWAEDEGLGMDHPIWARLDPTSPIASEYCQHIYQAEDQVFVQRKEYEHHARGHRYTVVGYPYGRHTTVEVRLLPMMATSDLAVRAIAHVLKITNAYLVATARREEKIKGVIELDPSETTEIHEVNLTPRTERRVIRS